MTSLEARAFEWSKNILGAFQTVDIFLTFGTWIGFFFLSLLAKKAQNFTHTFIQYASKTKIANSSKIYVQIYLKLCQLELLGFLLSLPWNKENSPCRNLGTPSRSQVGSKNKPRWSISVIAIAMTFGLWQSLPYLV